LSEIRDHRIVMNIKTGIRRFCLGLPMIALIGTASAQSCESEFCITWHTVDSGGVLDTQSADEQWRLAGTIGQWDATEARAQAGASWRLTGGFWALSLEELADLLFQDQFEEDQPRQNEQVALIQAKPGHDDAKVP